MKTSSRDHYSYAAYADARMAQTFEDRRLGGPIGEMVAGTQARVLANMIGRIQGRSILDVGTEETRRRDCQIDVAAQHRGD